MRSAVPDELIVLLAGEVAGILRRDRSGSLRFEYDPGWREEASGYPLSLSMPLMVTDHGDEVVRPYLEGLLSEDDARLTALGRQFHVSPRNPFGLLTYLGEDCAGAVQFVRPERLDLMRRNAADPEVVWLNERRIAEELRDLVARRVGGPAPGRDYGYFSLAGAQPKTALLFEDGRWGVPTGRIPTTHILKPPALRDADGFAINEHLCLRLASALDLPAASSEVRSFAGETAIVVQRYDRTRLDGELLRIHQEDACQALGISPHRKYEHEGGPGAADVIALLRAHSDDPEADTAAFIDSLVLNWVIGGTDAHAKNYSLLLLPGHEVRLAPLYDVVSMLPYPKMQAYRRLKLAMRIGREYQVWKIDRRRWMDLAERADLDPDPVIERVIWTVERIQANVAPVVDAVRAEGLAHDVIDRMEREFTAHAARCLSQLRIN